MFILENNILFGLLYGGIALVVLIYLTVTMSENGVEFTFNVKKQLQKRREWRKEWKERAARGETMVGWGEKRHRTRR